MKSLFFTGVFLFQLLSVRSIISINFTDLCDEPVTSPLYECTVSSLHLFNCSDGIINPSDFNSSWPFQNDPEPINVCSINATNSSIPFLSLNISSTGSLSCIDTTLCQIWIDLGQIGTLNVDGIIEANTIKIFAANAVISSEGLISSSGLGLIYGSYQGYNSGGGSHGGSGGSHEFEIPCPIDKMKGSSHLLNGITVETCCRKHRYTTLSKTIGSISEPDSTIDFWNLSFGSGGGIYNSTEGGRSGGRIGIYLSGNLIIEGRIESDGQTVNTALSHAGSGSGGTVIVQASNIICLICALERSIISARGGGVPIPSGTLTGGAGGGGRVVARVISPLGMDVTMTAAGGSFITTPQSVSCYIGSAGTVYISSVDYNMLKISNDGGIAYSSTMLDLESSGLSSVIDYISISNEAEVLATVLNLRKTGNNYSNDMYRGLYIDDSTLTMYADIDKELSIINTTVLSLGRLAFINTPLNYDLQIDCDDMTILGTSGVCFQGNLAISSSSFRTDADLDIGLTIPGNRRSGCTASSNILLDLRVSIFSENDVTFGSQVTLDVPRLVVAANRDIYIIGEVSTKKLQSVACPAPDPIPSRASCGTLLDNWPSALNYTTVLVALSGDVSISGSLEVNSAAICGGTVSIDGTIDASGLGCKSEDGWGPGVSSSGAGHVGIGGSFDGTPGGHTYDDPLNPMYPGSGGGNLDQDGGGPGGGYVLLSGKSSIAVNGIVTCDGDPGESASGGGSGGSIMVITVSLLGTGTISVNGGDGSSGDGSSGDGSSDNGGGGGSGGSIRFKSLLASDYILKDIGSNFYGLILANGGTGRNGGTNGANGTIISTNCAPGFQFFALRATCVPCGFGFWRNASFEGSLTCQICTNAPSGGSYSSDTSISEECLYTCAVGTLFPDCLSPFAQIAKIFGGELGFTLTVSLLTSSIVIVLLFLRCQRLQRVRALLVAEGEAAGPGGYTGVTETKLSNIRGAYSEDTATLRLLNNPNKSGSKGKSVYGSSQSMFLKSRFGISSNIRGGDLSSSVRPVGSSSMSVVLSMLRGNGPSFLPCTSIAPGEVRKDIVSVTEEYRMRNIASRLRDEETCSFLISISSLQEKDLALHVHRIYLSGSNTIGSSWRLPWEADRSLGRFVRPTSYAKFAARVNELLQWPRLGWEEFTYILLSYFYPPYAHTFLSERRRMRSILLLQAALACNLSHSWVRGAKARALQDCIRVGMSGDFTLAYIDILGVRTSSVDARRLSANFIPRGLSLKTLSNDATTTPSSTDASRGPILPLALLFAGDGTFKNPFYLDANDVLVRSVPSARGLSRFVDNEWIEFVAEVNARSRCLTAGAILQTSGPLLSFLQAVNRSTNEAGNLSSNVVGDLLGGLDVQLMRFWPAASSQFDDIGNQEADNTTVNEVDEDRAFVGEKKLRERIFENTIKLDTEVQVNLFGSDRRMSRAGHFSESESNSEEEDEDDTGSRRESTSSKATTTTTSSESDDDSSKKHEQPIGPSSPRSSTIPTRRKMSNDASALDRFGFGEDSRQSRSPGRNSRSIGPTSVGDLYESAAMRQEKISRSDERDPRSFGYGGRYSIATQELFQSNHSLENDDVVPEHSIVEQAPSGSRSKLWWANRVTSLSADVVSTSDSRMGLLIRLRTDVSADIVKKSTTESTVDTTSKISVEKGGASTDGKKKTSSGKDLSSSGAMSAAHWSAIDDINSFQFTVSDDGIGIDFKSSEKSRSVRKEESEDNFSPKPRSVVADSSDTLASGGSRQTRRMSVASFDAISSGHGPVVTPPLLSGLAYGSFKVDPDYSDYDSVLFSCFSETGNAIATSFVNLITNFVVDAGGDIDVEGKRVNMSLPYPGLPLSVVSPKRLYWSGEDVWCFGTRLSIFSAARLSNFSGRSHRSRESISTPFLMRVLASSGNDDIEVDNTTFGPSLSNIFPLISKTSRESNLPCDRADSIDSTDGKSRKFGEGLSSSDDHEFQVQLLYPAPPRWFMTAGITPFNLFSIDSRDRSSFSGIRTISGFLFLFSRLFTRNVPPIHPTRSWLFYAVAGLHFCLLLIELGLTVVIVAQISCIQPANEISTSVGPSQLSVPRLAINSKTFLVFGDCSFVEVTIFLALPPLTCLLSPLSGLAAIARGSSRALRTYALWNVVSLLTALIALILVVLNLHQLGLQTIIEPCLLFVVKILAAQLVPIQLSAIECARPVRGWKGLYEIREIVDYNKVHDIH